MGRATWVRAAACGAVVLLAGTGCGGRATEDEPAPGASEETTRLAQYCAKTIEIEETFAREFPAVVQAPPEEMPAAVKKVAGVVLPLFESVVAVAPEPVKGDVEQILGVIRTAAETGDASGFDTSRDVEKRVHAYALATCDWERSDVTASEYAFAGVPTTSAPGLRSFELSNKGKEVHEISILRINDDETASLRELLTQSPEQVMAKVQPVGLGFANPGETSFAVVDLQPGRYAVVCFVPVGLTPAVAEAAEKGQGPPPGGPPHASRGMAVEVNVA